MQAAVLHQTRNLFYTAQSRCSYGHEILSENEFYLVTDTDYTCNACYRAQLAMLKSLRHTNELIGLIEDDDRG